MVPAADDSRRGAQGRRRRDRPCRVSLRRRWTRMVRVGKEMTRQGFHAAAAHRRRDHVAGRTRRSRSPRATPARRSTCSMRRARRGRRQPALVRGSAGVPTSTRLGVEYERLRAEYGARDARARHHHARGSAGGGACSSTGARTSRPVPAGRASPRFDDYPLDELVPYIDWTPFFQAWELKGELPGDPRGFEGRWTPPRSSSPMRRPLLKRFVAERLVKARGAVLGLFAANSVGHDDIEVYAGEDRSEVSRRAARGYASNPRKAPGRPNLCLADYVAPKDSGRPDWVGAFAVTAGDRASTPCAPRFERDNDDYSSILAKALADRLTESARRAAARGAWRTEFWGYAPRRAKRRRDARRGAVPRDSAGARIPRVPRSHREADAVRSARRAQVRGHHADRIVRDVAGGPSVSGWYFAHPESALFRPGTHRPGSSGRLRCAEGGWRLKKSSAGWRPTWRTRREGLGWAHESGRGYASPQSRWTITAASSS